MPATSRRREPQPKPTFVFRGTVQKVKRATMRNVPSDDRTLIVRVNEVMESTKDMARLAGQDITVQLAGRARVTPGREMVFHTVPVMFGESVAVQSVKEESVGKSRAAFAGGGDPAARKATRDLQDRVADADVVVSGRVSAVKLPAEDTGGGAGRARAAAAPEMRRPVSEHDPKWRDAVVEVVDVHKGRRSKRKITVRFPDSTDVRWFKAPKFRVGQQGVFLLHKRKGEGGAAPAGQAARRAGMTAAAAGPAGADVYTALHPADFQPYSEADKLKAMVETHKRGQSDDSQKVR